MSVMRRLLFLVVVVAVTARLFLLLTNTLLANTLLSTTMMHATSFSSEADENEISGTMAPWQSWLSGAVGDYWVPSSGGARIRRVDEPITPLEVGRRSISGGGGGGGGGDGGDDDDDEDHVDADERWC